MLNRARAIENGAYVIAPCQYGTLAGGSECYGHSLIVDPWGRVLADGGEAENVIVLAEIDLAEVAKTRARIPSLTHDRPFAIESIGRQCGGVVLRTTFARRRPSDIAPVHRFIGREIVHPFRLQWPRDELASGPSPQPRLADAALQPAHILLRGADERFDIPAICDHVGSP